jgi:hypothetical protein
MNHEGTGNGIICRYVMPPRHDGSRAAAMIVLTINAGSSSVRLALFEDDTTSQRLAVAHNGHGTAAAPLSAFLREHNAGEVEVIALIGQLAVPGAGLNETGEGLGRQGARNLIEPLDRSRTLLARRVCGAGVGG